MNCAKQNEDEEAGKRGKDEVFFIAESEDEEDVVLNHKEDYSRYTSRGSSPPLLLAFNTPSLRDNTQSPTSSLDLEEEEDEEEEDQPIEEWMILGGEEQVGDSSIHLNVSYCLEDDSGDEDTNVDSIKDTWTVSEKDKSLPVRYFAAGRSMTCTTCNRTGHLAKSCYYHKKSPTCVLCGIQGHIQRNCPCRPCSDCGLPSHCFRPCERPPVWNQHCQRCGVAGHLSDACPDTWRQYHLTIQLEVPLRPRTVNTLRQRKSLAHCYNCSERGHFGYECTKRRMISGTSPSLPYVVQYDTIEDIMQQRQKIQKKAKELKDAGSLPLPDKQHLSEGTKEIGEENQPAWSSRGTKQATYNRAGRRKTWPEKRKERREVKRLRRQAQARREGGLLGKSRRNFDDEVCPEDPSRSLLGHRQPTPPQEKMRGDKESVKRSRKSRESETWKKRGGIKHGDLYPHGEVDINSQNLLSPKQRVRHRKR